MKTLLISLILLAISACAHGPTWSEVCSQHQAYGFASTAECWQEARFRRAQQARASTEASQGMFQFANSLNNLGKQSQPAMGICDTRTIGGLTRTQCY